MTYKSELVDNSFLNTRPHADINIILHPKVIDISFENRTFIKNVFLNFKGNNGISHMAIYCINPSRELLIFSTTPAIEHNLLYKDLWSEDQCFTIGPDQEDKLVWWDYENQEIERLKLRRHRFIDGASFCKSVNDFRFIFSFATDEQIPDLRKYYHAHLMRVMTSGVYFYNGIRTIYSEYSEHVPPGHEAFGLNIKSGLYLVQNQEVIKS